VRDLPEGAIVRAAIGLSTGDGRFLPMAHTLDVEAPPSGESPISANEVVVWEEAGTRPATPAEARVAVAASATTLHDAYAIPGLPSAAAVEAGATPELGPPSLPRSVRPGLSSAELAERARRYHELAAAGLGGLGLAAGASDQFGPSSSSWASPAR
jgi:hypothetical protein